MFNNEQLTKEEYEMKLNDVMHAKKSDEPK